MHLFCKCFANILQLFFETPRMFFVILKRPLSSVRKIELYYAIWKNNRKCFCKRFAIVFWKNTQNMSYVKPPQVDFCCFKTSAVAEMILYLFLKYFNFPPKILEIFVRFASYEMFSETIVLVKTFPPNKFVVLYCKIEFYTTLDGNFSLKWNRPLMIPLCRIEKGVRKSWIFEKFMFTVFYCMFTVCLL